MQLTTPKTIRKVLIVSAATLALALPASAQIVSGSGGLVGEGQIGGVPGVGVAGQGAVNGSVGVDAGELRDRTRATARGTVETAKRTTKRVKNKAERSAPSVSASASGSAGASSEGASVDGAGGVSVTRPN